MKNVSKSNLWILVAGILAVGAGVFVLISSNKTKQANTEAVVATVTAYEEGEQFNSSTDALETVYYPVVRFSVNGDDMECTYSQFYNSEKYPIGESIEIHYSPENPAGFTIDEDNRSGVTAAWEIPVGILLIAFAIFRIVREKKASQEC